MEMILSRRNARCALLALGVLILSLPRVAVAQPQAADTVQIGTLATLRDRIEQRYQVLPLQNGIVLIPKYGTTDIQSIELAGETIAVNGQAVTGAELRQRIGDDADLVTRLSFLDPQTRQVLFALGVSPATPAAPDTAVAAAEPEPAPGPEPAELEAEDGTGDRVRIGGSVRVRPGEVIDGDVVAVGGSVRVDGRVRGEVVAVGGAVDLGPAAVVEGDITAVGGRIHRAPGARVEGSINEVAIGVPNLRFHRGVRREVPFFAGIGGVIGTVMGIALLGLLTCLALLLGRRPIERMEHRVRSSPWKAAAVGLAGQLLFFPALVLTIVVLAITIIGIPLLLVIPFAIVALVVGILLGFTAVAKTVGHEAEGRFAWSHASPYLSLLVGVGLIMAISFFGAVLGIGGGPLKFFAVALGILGFVVQYVAWTIGFGALLLTRFGTRYRWGDEGAAEPPPSAGEPGLAPASTSPAPPAGA